MSDRSLWAGTARNLIESAKARIRARVSHMGSNHTTREELREIAKSWEDDVFVVAMLELHRDLEIVGVTAETIASNYEDYPLRFR